MASALITDSVRGCLAGVALGDALGFPVEILSREEILKTLGPKGVTGFIDPIQGQCGKKWGSTAHLRAGHTTDDWQLTAAVARSLIRRGGFDSYDQAAELVAELNRDTCGWGGTTRRAGRILAASLAAWPSDRAAEFDHVTPPPTDRIPGVGNGVAMKIAPLALFRFLRDGTYRHEPLASQVMALGLQTHGDPRASFAAAAVAFAISAALYCRENGISKPKRVRRSIQVISRNCVEHLEFRYMFFRPARPKLSSRLDLALSLLDDPDRLRRAVGTDGFILESIPFSLATALRHLDDFRAALLEAVNAGGDTDTNASMVGAIVGANVGLSGIPADWLKAVPNSAVAIDLADRLLAVAGG